MLTFGPVSSRRLGKSLGINNISHPKVCSYNCIYCQVGKTIRLTARPETFFEPEIIFNEVKNHLTHLGPENFPDYMTFVANGEPTLDINLGQTIRLLKKLEIPIAIITNGSLLSDKSVRKDVQLADWVSVKVDSPDQHTWNLLNRPYTGLSFDRHIEGILLFASEYKGFLCTETMILKGVNDDTEMFSKLAGIIEKLHPHKAYLSIPTRPPSVQSVEMPDINKVNEVCRIFSEKQIRTEPLIGFEGTDIGYTGNIYDDLLNIIAVHPLREDALRILLYQDKADFSCVESLIRQKIINVVRYNGEKYYIRQYSDQI